MEVPLRLLIARHRACGIRLKPAPPRWKVPVGESKPKTPGLRLNYVEQRAFEQALSKEEFFEGDSQYWITVPPDAKYIICRVCNRPVRNMKTVRKEHLRNTHCSEVIRKLELKLQDKPWCTCCGATEAKYHHLWHWGFKFCSNVCMQDFKTTFQLAKQVMPILIELRREFKI